MEVRLLDSWTTVLRVWGAHHPRPLGVEVEQSGEEESLTSVHSNSLSNLNNEARALRPADMLLTWPGRRVIATIPQSVRTWQTGIKDIKQERIYHLTSALHLFTYSSFNNRQLVPGITMTEIGKWKCLSSSFLEILLWSCLSPIS